MRGWVAPLLSGWMAVAGATRAAADDPPARAVPANERPANELSSEPHSTEGAFDGRLVLRPEVGLEPLARQTADVLARRTGAVVRVGGPPRSRIRAGEVALVREPDGVRVVVAQQGPGARAATALRLDRFRGAAAARAVALAVESLNDPAPVPRATTRDVPAVDDERPPPVHTGAAPQAASTAAPVEAPPRRELARPVFFLRMMLGISPLRGDPLLGPGAGFGLCGGPHCVVLEGDLSVIPLERRGQTGVEVRYRFFNGGVRFQFRPWVWDDLSLGFTFGLLTRMGRATIVDREESQLVSNLAGRGTLELGYRLVGPLELVFEVGTDLAITRARFLRDGQDVFLEDRWTPWLVAGFRVRP